MLTSFSIITYGYEFLLLIVSSTGIVFYKRLTLPFKVLSISIICSFIIAILSNILVAKHQTNAPVLHVESVSEFVFYALTYYYLFTNQKIKNVVIIFIIAVILFSIFNALFLQPFNKIFPTNVSLLTLGILVAFSLLLFKEMLLYPLITPILKQGVFWYNTAIVFYSTTMFLNIGLSNIYSKNQSIDYLVFYVWYLILYIFTILIAIALITDSKETYKTDAL